VSDEAAFLEALKAHPADDTARLVYADWLDERNREVEAEYLRLTAELAATGPVIDRGSAALPRLIDLAVALPPAWMAAAGSRFDLLLDGYLPEEKISTIRLLRGLFGFGLAAAKVVSEALPCVLVARAPAYFLLAIERTIFAVRRLRLRVTQTEARFRREPYLFNALATCSPYNASHQQQLVRAITQLLGRSPIRIERDVRNDPVRIADGIDARTVGEYQAALARALPPAELLAHISVLAEPVRRTT